MLCISNYLQIYLFIYLFGFILYRMLCFFERERERERAKVVKAVSIQYLSRDWKQS